tara:strand:+ start:244 stop:441 length:198 start_codon:yes stop_codon:yes gene_type:complete
LRSRISSSIRAVASRNPHSPTDPDLVGKEPADRRQYGSINRNQMQCARGICGFGLCHGDGGAAQP